MNKSAFVVRSHIRNVVLCSLLTFGLAACGADEGSGSSGTASAASDPIPSLVAPSVGVIDRTSETGIPSAVTTGTNVAANTTQVAGNTTQTTTNTTQGNTPVSSTTPTWSSTTVASNNKTSTNSSPPAKSSNPSTGTATLDWMPPTENTDGSVLTNLAGYTVYYGTSAGNLTQSVKITNPGLTAYTLSNLPSGTWYFAVTSYSSTGIESSRSGVVSTSI
jgi:hypothetical protein